jgi:hypothetical protein
VGKLEAADGSPPRAAVEGLSVYLNMDKAGRCVGLYVVGSDKEARAKGMGGLLRPSSILSRAVGHPMTILQPTEAASKEDSGLALTTRDGKVPITTRWRAGSLIELRIGDATP